MHSLSPLDSSDDFRRSKRYPHRRRRRIVRAMDDAVVAEPRVVEYDIGDRLSSVSLTRDSSRRFSSYFLDR